MAVLKKNGSGDIPWLSANLVIEYEDANMAKNIMNSLSVDNQKFISCKREEKRIICVARADRVSTLLHTLDDFLACLIAAEDVYRSI